MRLYTLAPMLTGDIKARFGSAVRTQRKRMGISQEELAGRAGLHRTYVADIERGARNLSLANIEKLAHALEVSIPTLFTHAISAEGSRPQIAEDVVEILLVEDEAGDIELTLSAFETAKLTNRVHIVRDGAEALDYVFCQGQYAGRTIQHRPHIILLDLKLPKVSGLEVLRLIKSDKRTQSIPVAVLTVSKSQQDIAECMRLGAETYIVKPVDFQRLAEITPRLELSWALLQHRGPDLAAHPTTSSPGIRENLR